MLSIFARKHFKLIDRNSTSIQELALGNKLELVNVYDLGRELNWKQVMGEDVKWWFIPIDRPQDRVGDGITWEKVQAFKKSKTRIDGKDFKEFEDEEIDTEIGSQKGNKLQKSQT